MQPAKQRVVQAVNFLIETDKFASWVKELRTLIAEWDTHPMAYSGDLSHLNALVDVGLRSPETFDELIKLVEGKRKLIPETRRVDYQKTLMAERRARMRKAVQLQERLKGKMTSAARAAYQKGVQDRWMKARGEHLDRKAIELGRPLTWAERNDAAQEFWAKIDAQLDASLQKK